MELLEPLSRSETADRCVGRVPPRKDSKDVNLEKKVGVLSGRSEASRIRVSLPECSPLTKRLAAAKQLRDVHQRIVAHFLAGSVVT